MVVEKNSTVTETAAENIALMTVIYRAGSIRKRGTLMTQEQFESEKNYRVSLEIAKRMLLAEIIDEQDYKKIDTILLGKYRPLLGCLCCLKA